MVDCLFVCFFGGRLFGFGGFLVCLLGFFYVVFFKIYLNLIFPEERGRGAGES